jgi:predicted nicotinamide N-methyase
MQNDNILLLDETGFIPSFTIPKKELQLANAATSAWIQAQKTHPRIFPTPQLSK